MSFTTGPSRRLTLSRTMHRLWPKAASREMVSFTPSRFRLNVRRSTRHSRELKPPAVLLRQFLLVPQTRVEVSCSDRQRWQSLGQSSRGRLAGVLESDLQG